MNLIEKIQKIQVECLSALEQVHSSEALTEVEQKYLSKKGEFSQALKALKDVSPEERPKVGACANEAKQKIEAVLVQKREEILEKQLNEQFLAEGIDYSLPSTKKPIGALHPITLVTQEIINIFKKLGFDLSQGPEVETEFFNFDALNMSADHPARDMQDTFYFPHKSQQGPRVLLRTQTSNVQIHTMLKKKKPPIRILSPGAVFRSDYDMTHTPMFHQVEGLYVDKHVSFSELKGCLLFFAREMFGPQTQIRMRPSFFPFVEPGAEVDVTCMMCNGSGQLKSDAQPCRVCKTTGWLEILGAGMVHPKVFEAVQFDVSEVSGFAFGMGVERIAMLKYGIPDLRLMYENDVRFLRQFSGMF